MNKNWSLVSNSSIDFYGGSSCSCSCDRGKTKSTPSPKTEVWTWDLSLTKDKIMIAGRYSDKVSSTLLL